jgi:hypothetical protein
MPAGAALQWLQWLPASIYCCNCLLTVVCAAYIVSTCAACDIQYIQPSGTGMLFQCSSTVAHLGTCAVTCDTTKYDTVTAPSAVCNEGSWTVNGVCNPKCKTLSVHCSFLNTYIPCDIVLAELRFGYTVCTLRAQHSIGHLFCAVNKDVCAALLMQPRMLLNCLQCLIVAIGARHVECSCMQLRSCYCMQPGLWLTSVLCHVHVFVFVACPNTLRGTANMQPYQCGSVIPHQQTCSTTCNPGYTAPLQSTCSFGVLSTVNGQCLPSRKYPMSTGQAAEHAMHIAV